MLRDNLEIDRAHRSLQGGESWRPEAQVPRSTEQEEGYCQFTPIRGDIFVAVQNYARKAPGRESVPDAGVIQFSFLIAGEFTLVAGHEQAVRISRPSLLVWKQSSEADDLRWTTPTERQRIVTIGVHPDFLTKLFAASDTELPVPLQEFVARPASTLSPLHLALTAQMFDVAIKLIHDRLHGALALVYTEALALELLCAAISTWCAPSSAGREYTERQRRCLQQAHSVLTRQLSPVPNIQRLARAVGMAETSLMTGFKAVYGETIYNFSIRCRMQHALALLRDRQWSIDKVSEAVGYSHSTSFATAFRRHFGVRPIDVKREKFQAGNWTRAAGARRRVARVPLDARREGEQRE